MNYRPNYLYPLQVWFLTVITAPIIIGVWLVGDLTATEIDQTISLIGIGIAISAGLSVPTLFVYYVIFFVLISRDWSSRRVKTILAAVAILGIIVTFEVIGLQVMELDRSDLVLPLSFIISIIFFSYLFRIQKRKRAEPYTINNSEEPLA